MRARRLAVALVALLVAGCGGASGGRSIAVGARDDAESVLLAHLYAAALRTYGTAAHVETVPDPLAGLDSGAVDVVPGFTGRLLDTFAPGAKARAAAQVYRDMASSLPEGVVAGDYTESAEDKPALAVTEATVDAWGGRDVSAAVRNCAQLKVGLIVGAPRPAAVGTCKAKVRGYPDSTTLFEALRTGQVNAVWTSTADPDIPVDAVVLADRTALIRAENVVPLYRRNELSETQVRALNEVAGVLDTAALVQMRRQMAAGAHPGQVADAFLAEHPLGATSH
jgi:osmoprotectant transport system substrate-binding protein